MQDQRSLIEQLADGRLHSGPELANGLGCSRAAVWKRVHRLQDLGLDIESVRGRGYRLAHPLELLDAARIRRGLSAAVAARIESLDVQLTMDSTNRYLLEQPAPTPGHCRVALAEFQTGGRGRRGRRWLSPLGSGLCLSVSWLFEAAPANLAALSLAAGVATCRALSASGASGLGLKWPNDVVAGDGKLAGLLLDVEGEADGPLKLVLGVGVNLFPDPRLHAQLDERSLLPVALAGLVAGRPSRNRVAAALIDELVVMLDEFTVLGFSAFADAWRQLDVLYGHPVEVQIGARRMHGVARGISLDGALLVEADGELQTVISGDVSVRRR